MSGGLMLVVWSVLVVAGIGSMQWGAARASGAVEALRDATGLRGTAAGAVLGVATAAPEIAVGLASVGLGWPDLGLGTALGSNVPALPLVMLLAWTGVRGRRPGAPAGDAVRAEAVPVQAVPYLLVVVLLAALTLPPPIAGLQPVDGAILAGAWAAYTLHALLRPRRRAPTGPTPSLRPALLALPAIAGGALAAVIAARAVASAFGSSDLVAGLFVVGLLCALPESVAARRLARDGRATTAVSTAMADGVVSLTLALVAPALVGSAVGDASLYAANLGYLAFALVAYVLLSHARHGQPLSGGRVAVFVGGYAFYLGIVVLILAG